jgi:hypothetical protein
MRGWSRLSCGLALLAGLTGCAQAAGLRCPGRMPGPHDGFEVIGRLPTSALPLDGMRLFDGPPGEETQPAPAELAPDGTTEAAGRLTAEWRFAGHERLLVVCTYRDTTSYYRAAPAKPPAHCTLARGPDGTIAECD